MGSRAGLDGFEGKCVNIAGIGNRILVAAVRSKTGLSQVS